MNVSALFVDNCFGATIQKENKKTEQRNDSLNKI